MFGISFLAYTACLCGYPGEGAKQATKYRRKLKAAEALSCLHEVGCSGLMPIGGGQGCDARKSGFSVTASGSKGIRACLLRMRPTNKIPVSRQMRAFVLAAKVGCMFLTAGGVRCVEEIDEAFIASNRRHIASRLRGQGCGQSTEYMLNKPRFFSPVRH